MMRTDSRLPDVVGYALDDAQQTLAAAGWRLGEIVETRPPRRTLQDPRRVVRERVDGQGLVELVVCGERSDDARL